VIFDRSWYNRADVEYVMGFCTKEQHRKFLELCPITEKYMVDGGIILIKYWMEVGKKEQQRRFEARIKDPLRQWKLSPMDLELFRRWYESPVRETKCWRQPTASMQLGISSDPTTRKKRA
jgi:polyphosphate kinase